MERYVAFLRGINVGGRTVTKEKLTEAFTSLGFQNVSTYKQSGNVIFETEIVNPKEIKDKIEEKLCSMLGYKVSVFVRTFPQLKSIIEHNAFKDQDNESSSFLVTFLAATTDNFPLQLPLTIPKSKAQVISAKGTEVFSVTHGGGEGALPNPFLESKLKVKATTRNINTIRQMLKSRVTHKKIVQRNSQN
jgi:uncharacterized protein (DUF1697 family)